MENICFVSFIIAQKEILEHKISRSSEIATKLLNFYHLSNISTKEFGKDKIEQHNRSNAILARAFFQGKVVAKYSRRRVPHRFLLSRHTNYRRVIESGRLVTLNPLMLSVDLSPPPPVKRIPDLVSTSLNLIWSPSISIGINEIFVSIVAYLTVLCAVTIAALSSNYLEEIVIAYTNSER